MPKSQNKFKQLDGKHTHKNGEKTKAGDVVLSDDNLSVMFPNRFRNLTEEESEIHDLRESKKQQTQKKKRSKSSNVTEEFPEAIEGGYKVAKSGSNYKVADADGNVISDELSSKKAVSDFITEHASQVPDPE